MGAQEEQVPCEGGQVSQSWLNLNKKGQPAKKQLETSVKANKF